MRRHDQHFQRIQEAIHGGERLGEQLRDGCYLCPATVAFVECKISTVALIASCTDTA